MTGMTLEPGGPEPSGTFLGIANRCLRRKSVRTYELINPSGSSGMEGVCYDVGQLREIVLMDRRLREEGTVTSVPAGFLDFATRFNDYAEGPERFATYEIVDGQYVVHTDGSPIIWEQFLIANSLVNRNDAQEPGLQLPPQSDFQPVFGFMDNSSNPQLHSLSTHMHGAVKTTDQLTRFWIKRGSIEQQYASRLADLAEATIGEHELPEIRHAIDGLRIETAKQAMNRFELAKQIAVELETRCVELQLKQTKHWREVYEPTARKLHTAHVREKRRRSGVATEWKQEYKKLRYSLDFRRLESMKAHNYQDSLTWTPSSEWTLSSISSDSSMLNSESAQEWENLRESCAALERDRSCVVKDMLSAFSDTLSAVCAADNESYIIMRKSKDLFRPDNLIEEFDLKFGSAQQHRPSGDGAGSERQVGMRAVSGAVRKARPLPIVQPKNMLEGGTGSLSLSGSLSSTSRALPPPPDGGSGVSLPRTVRPGPDPLPHIPNLPITSPPRRPLTVRNVHTTSHGQPRGRPTLHKLTTTTLSRTQFV